MSIPVRNHKAWQFLSCAVKGKELYVRAFQDSYKMRIDLTNGEMHYLDYINLNDEDRAIGGSVMILDHDDMIMVPNDRKLIARYHLKNGKCDRYPLHVEPITQSRPNYSWAAMYDNKIYVFPCYDTHVYVCDMESGAIQKEQLPIHMENISDKNPCVGIETACQVGDKVYLFSGKYHVLLIYGLSDHNVSCIHMTIPFSEDDPLCDVSFWDGLFYCLTSRGTIFSAGLKTGKIAYRKLWKGTSDLNTYQRILATSKNLWMLPDVGEDIKVYSLEDGRVDVYQDYPEDFSYELFFPVQSKFFMGYDNGDDYIFSMCAQNYMLTIHRKTGTVDWLKIHPPTMEEKKKFFIEKMHYNNIIYENRELGLAEFCDAVSSNLDLWKKEDKNENMRTWSELVSNL